MARPVTTRRSTSGAATKSSVATRRGAASAVATPIELDPATEMAASGALIEPAIVAGIDTTHPAIDANPRANTTAEQNRIDLNDPTKTDAEAVADNLKTGK